MWFQSVGENMEHCGPIGHTAQFKKSGLDKFKKICYNKKKTHFFPIGAAAFIVVTPHMVHPIGRAGPSFMGYARINDRAHFQQKKLHMGIPIGNSALCGPGRAAKPHLYYTMGLAASQ